MEKMTSLHIVIEMLEEMGYKPIDNDCELYKAKKRYYFNGSNYIRIAGDHFETDIAINHHKEYQPARDVATYYVNSTRKYFHNASL